MTYADDAQSVQPLVRADKLLRPQAAVRPDPRLMLLASTGFAASGLLLGFIMLMGLGYDSLGDRTAVPIDAASDPRTVPYGQIGGPDIIEAVPLRDEEGRPLEPALKAKP